MQIYLNYGDSHINLEIPQKNIANIINPWKNETDKDNDSYILDSLSEDTVSDFKSNITGKKVCILTGDGTRDMPLNDILPRLLEYMTSCEYIQFIICTGTHVADTEKNRDVADILRKSATESGIDFDVHIHDCFNDNLINAGLTSRQTPVLYNSKCKDMDLFVVLSDVKCHYFGGYSNPVKNFIPGICSYDTAEKNHSLALDDNSTFGVHPWHSDKKRKNNPLATDQLEGMNMILNGRDIYAFVTISSSGKIQWAGFDKAESITSQAFDMADKMNTHTIKPEDYLIVSPGGLPNDVDMYIAQRALELTKRVVNDNGHILFVSQCPEGVGQEHTLENFYNRLTLPIEQILKGIEGQYKLFSHKPYKFAQLIQRMNKIWIYSKIDPEMITAMHMSSTDNPQKIVDDWLQEDPNCKINIVDGANKLALYAKK